MSRYTDQEVLDAARRMFDSVRDGTLTILSKAKAAGGEVWDVRHRPDGATRMTEVSFPHQSLRLEGACQERRSS